MQFLKHASRERINKFLSTDFNICIYSREHAPSTAVYIIILHPLIYLQFEIVNSKRVQMEGVVDLFLILTHIHNSHCTRIIMMHV